MSRDDRRSREFWAAIDWLDDKIYALVLWARKFISKKGGDA